MEENFKSPIFKRWWFWLILVVVAIAAALITLIIRNEMKMAREGKTAVNVPDCPSNLEGILTHPLIDMAKVSHIIPLGNVSPPQHTFSVDHLYFNTDSTEKIALYAPANSKITQIITVQAESQGKPDYVVQYTICKGLKLDFAGYTELAQPLLDKLKVAKSENCQNDIDHQSDLGTSDMCNYPMDHEVKSGELIGYTQASVQKDKNSLKLPFEIWAANYNKAPQKDVDYSYYQDSRYPYTFCPLDLYTSIMSKPFYDKIGIFVEPHAEAKKDGKEEKKEGKEEKRENIFQKRTAEPLCGVIHQDVVGTIQGSWFGDNFRNPAGDPEQFAFIHWNIDPTYGEISNGGEITNGEQGVVKFLPKHNGTIDREPSEVKADGKVYCYNYSKEQEGGIKTIGKVLVKLVDNRHLKLEHKHGSCSDNETFDKPYDYER